MPKVLAIELLGIEDVVRAMLRARDIFFCKFPLKEEVANDFF